MRHALARSASIALVLLVARPASAEDYFLDALQVVAPVDRAAGWEPVKDPGQPQLQLLANRSGKESVIVAAAILSVRGATCTAIIVEGDELSAGIRGTLRDTASYGLDASWHPKLMSHARADQSEHLLLCMEGRDQVLHVSIIWLPARLDGVRSSAARLVNDLAAAVRDRWDGVQTVVLPRSGHRLRIDSRAVPWQRADDGSDVLLRLAPPLLTLSFSQVEQGTCANALGSARALASRALEAPAFLPPGWDPEVLSLTDPARPVEIIFACMPRRAGGAVVVQVAHEGGFAADLAREVKPVLVALVQVAGVTPPAPAAPAQPAVAAAQPGPAAAAVAATTGSPAAAVRSEPAWSSDPYSLPSLPSQPSDRQLSVSLQQRRLGPSADRELLGVALSLEQPASRLGGRRHLSAEWAVGGGYHEGGAISAHGNAGLGYLIHLVGLDLIPLLGIAFDKVSAGEMETADPISLAASYYYAIAGRVELAATLVLEARGAVIARTSDDDATHLSARLVWLRPGRKLALEVYRRSYDEGSAVTAVGLGFGF